MNTIIPNILIGLGALIVAAGAYLSQLGWNKASEATQRIEMVRNLAETNLANYQTINRVVLPAEIHDQRADPVELDVLTAGLQHRCQLHDAVRRVVERATRPVRQSRARARGNKEPC
jgi:hypothetical protein